MIELKITIDEIDYCNATDMLIPILQEKLTENKELSYLAELVSDSKLANNAVKSVLRLLPQERKDSLAVSIAQKYRVEIAKALQDAAQKKGLGIKVCGIEAEIMDC